MEEFKNIENFNKEVTKITNFHKNQMGHMINLMRPKTQDCPHCENTGIMHVANGPDDVDEEYCGCLKGEELQELSKIVQ